MGCFAYESKHFKVPTKSLADKTKLGCTILIDMDSQKIRVKRPVNDNENETMSGELATTDSSQSDYTDKPASDDTIDMQSILPLLPKVVELMQSVGRNDDFVAVLKAISDKTLSVNNIALHLLLDIGQFLRQNTVYNIRYHQTTLNFWTVFHKLFKGKGIRFFRGLKAGGLMGPRDELGPVKPQECGINFIVPSDNILKREGDLYRTEASKPGILKTTLELFAKTQSNPDVKLAFDGKKIAMGFGKSLGEEDLGGYEEKPTLEEREQRLKREISLFDDVLNIVCTLSLKHQTIADTPEAEQFKLKTNCLNMVKILSDWVREQRVLLVKKRLAVGNLLKRIEGPWLKSPLANAISFIQTKIIHLKSSIQNCLECIDNLCFFISMINGTDSMYVRGCGTPVVLGKQENFVCLRELDESFPLDALQQPEIVKQRTTTWSNLRKGAQLTGSKIHSALGFGTLKSMQECHDQRGRDESEPISPELQSRFDHGTKNEVNAVATIVGKILPVFFPGLMFYEDGCSILTLDHGYSVISGDGSGVKSTGEAAVAFEIKCPMPNKKYTTDLYYSLPLYYILQILSQMAVKGSESFVNVCYTAESTSILTGEFDDRLWEEVHKVMQVYSATASKRPTKKPQWVGEITPLLDEFRRNTVFLCEIPSLVGVPCSCSNTPATDVSNVRGHHTAENDISFKPTVEAIAADITRAKEAVTQSYEHMRRPAKELLLTVISDLNRTHTSENISIPHALPIMYHLGGFSLRMESVRRLFGDAMEACSDNNLQVRVIAADGQFAEISVDDWGKPLTVCRLAKQIWDNSKSMRKGQQLNCIFDKKHIEGISNMADVHRYFEVEYESHGAVSLSIRTGYQQLVTPITACMAVSGLDKTVKNVSDENKQTQSTEIKEDFIFQYLPQDIVDGLDEKCLEIIQNANEAIAAAAPVSINDNESAAPDASNDDMSFDSQNHNTATNEQETYTKESNCGLLSDNEYEAVLCALIASKMPSKWETTELNEFKIMLSSAESIRASFTVPELKTILRLHTTHSTIGCKSELVKKVSQIYGDGSIPVASPKSLKQLVKQHVKSWPKVATNIVYASNTCMAEYEKWCDNNIFKGSSLIITDDDYEFYIPQWYAQPSLWNNEPVEFIIDPHHLFVNNRSRCCSYGMAGMGISPKAWRKVAENERENKAGLSVELAIELRDRQCNEFAQATFSEAVERTMIEYGNTTEAEWCRLIRNWYKAVDEAGVPVHQRITWLLDMRHKLLSQFKFGEFPPPGAHVNGLPIVQFEGLMCNIDRRLQLYAIVSGGAYNQRSVSSLDSETFFSSLQELDPKGTGVLRPDDIPLALGTATCILNHKLSGTRTFNMNTSTKRVYPEHMSGASGDGVMGVEHVSSTKGDTSKIMAHSHSFDIPLRKHKKPRRKGSTIGRIGTSSKGATGVRSFHKINEEKILPHRKEMIKDSEMVFQ